MSSTLTAATHSRSPRRLADAGTARSQTGIPPKRLPAPPGARRGPQFPRLPVRVRQQQIRHSYPESNPHLRIDLLGIPPDKAVDARAFLAQMLQLAHKFHPGLFTCPGIGGQLVLDCFRDKIPKRDAPLGRDRLRTAKNDIRNFKS